MFPSRHWLVACIIFVSAGGCASIAEEYNHTMELQNRLSHAAALEESRNYAEAVKEYEMIAETYPESYHYKKAVRKAAMLSIHPDNSYFDPDVSLQWFKVLAGLSLSPAEQENVRLHMAQLERIRDLQYSIYEMDYDSQKVLATSEKQTRKLVERDKQIQLLEAELSWTREELRKMKEVDVRLHKSRSSN